MSSGEEAVLLNFSKFTFKSGQRTGQLTGEQVTIAPKDNKPDDQGRPPSVWISFDAVRETNEFQAFCEGLVHIRNWPSAEPRQPLPIAIDSKDGFEFGYEHDFGVDRVIAAVAFPGGYTADNLDPWPDNAKSMPDGRLAVLYERSTPNKLTLQWQLCKLDDDVMAEVARIKQRDRKGERLVLFIHGLGGHQMGTWGDFPKFLLQDTTWAKKHKIAFFSYPTMLWRHLFSRKAPKIQELAAALRTQIQNRYAEYQDIVLVCHSLGGLVAQQYLINEIKAKQPLRVTGIVLFAVPNNGADLASVGNLISIGHWQLKQLCRESDLLDGLNSDWITLELDKSVRVKYIAGMQDRIVDRSSARRSWGNDLETVDRSHTNIVKPTHVDDDAVLILKRFLTETRRRAIDEVERPLPPPTVDTRAMRVMRDLADQLDA